MKKNFYHKNFKSRTVVAAFLLTAEIFSCQSVSAEEDILEIPGQILIMSKTQWDNRKINFVGSGTKNLLIYGNLRNGAVNDASLNSDEMKINIYAGYFDGDLEENEIVDVTGNLIVVAGGDEGWLLYEDNNFVDAANKLLFYERYDRALKVNLIAARSGYGNASGNAINIYGGTLNGYVIAAENKSDAPDYSENIHDNEINIFNSPNLREIKLYGAALYSDETRERTPTFGTDNRLNFYTKNIEVSELGGFTNYSFFLPENFNTLTLNDSALKVTGGNATDLTGSEIFVVIPQVPSIDQHKKISLIQNNAGLYGVNNIILDGVNDFDDEPQWQRNHLAIYDIDTKSSDANNVLVGFIGRELTPQTKFIAQIRLPTLINSGSDFIGDLFSRNGENIFDAGAQNYQPFFAISHGVQNHKSGQNVENRITNLIGGFSRKFENEKHTFLIAPMIEFGRGNFDSYLENDDHATGNSQYLGGGIVFHDTKNNGAFFEGSLRAGRLKNNFQSADFMFNGQKVYDGFKSNSYYIGAHIGAGREVELNEREKFTYYGKFLFSHTGAKTLNLLRGDTINLNSVNSERIILGVRESYEFSPKNKIYAGLAYQYEFGGNSYVIYDGLKMDSPKIKGGSGIIDIGWTVKPYGNDKLSLDLSGKGIFGKNRGLAGRFGLNWNF